MRNEEWDTVRKLQEINKPDEELRGLNFSKSGAQEEQPKKNEKRDRPKEKTSYEPKHEKQCEDQPAEKPAGLIAGTAIRAIGHCTIFVGIVMLLIAVSESNKPYSTSTITIWMAACVIASGLLFVCAGSVTSNTADQLATSRKILDELKALSKKLDE